MTIKNSAIRIKRRRVIALKNFSIRPNPNENETQEQFAAYQKQRADEKAILQSRIANYV